MEHMFSSTISLTSVLDRGGLLIPHPSHFTRDGVALRLVHDSAEPSRVVSPISTTLPWLPYKIGTNTKCATIQTFSMFLLFGYKIKNHILQNTPSSQCPPLSEEA